MACSVFGIADGDEVYERLADASRAAREEFFELLTKLAEDPFPGGGNLLPYRDDDRPDTYTGPFGDGILVYRIFDDPECVVQLIDVVMF